MTYLTVEQEIARAAQTWREIAGQDALAKTTTAVYNQSAFRGRNDDGSETTATWKAALNTGWEQAVNTVFRLRWEVEETATASPSGTVSASLAYSHNGGAWTVITTTSSVVRYAASSNFAAGAATTNQLSSSGRTFVAGYMEEGPTLNSGVVSLTNQHTEFEAALQIVGTDVAGGDTIQIRGNRSYASVLAYDTYTNIATISIPLSDPGGSFPLTDTFTDTDGTALQSHFPDSSVGSNSIWHPMGFANGTISITQDVEVRANHAQSGGATSRSYRNTAVPSSAEYDVQADVTIVSAAAQCVLHGRMTDIGTTGTAVDRYQVTHNTATTAGAFNLGKYVGGTLTTLDSKAGTGATSGTVALKLELRTAAKKVYVDGVEELSTSDDAITQVGRAGFMVFSNQTNTRYIDNFSATNAGGGPTLLSRSGGVTPAGIAAKAALAIRLGANTPAGVARKATMRNLSGALGPAGVPAMSKLKYTSATGALTPAGNAIKVLDLRRGGAITPTATVAAQLARARALSGAITPAATASKTIVTTEAGAQTPTGAIASSKSKVATLAGASSPAGNLLRSLNLARGGTVTPSAAAMPVKATSVVLAGTATSAGVARKAVDRVYQGVVAAAGSVAAARSLARALAGATAPSAAVTKAAALVQSGAVTPTGDANTSGGASASLSGAVTPAAVIAKVPALSRGNVDGGSVQVDQGTNEDGYIQYFSTVASYADLRAGTAGSVYVGKNDENIQVGQDLLANTVVAIGYIAFDLSAVQAGPLASAQLSLYCWGHKFSGALPILRVREYDWGPTLTSADWVPGDNVTGDILATLDTWEIQNTGGDQRYWFTEVGTRLRDAINAHIASGTPLRLIITTDRFDDGIAPTGGEYVNFNDYNGWAPYGPPLLDLAYVQIASGAIAKTRPLTFAGAVTPTGALAWARALARVLTGTASGAGAVVRSVATMAAGSVTPTATLSTSGEATASLDGTVTPAGAATKAVAQMRDGAVTGASSLAKALAAVLAGSTGTAGAVIKDATVAHIGAVAPSATVQTEKAKFVGLDGAVAAAGVVGKGLSRVLTAASTPAGAVFRAVLQVVAGTATPEGAIAKHADLGAAGALAPEGDAGTEQAPSLQGTVEPSGTVVKAAERFLSANQTLAGTAIRLIEKSATAAVTPTGATRGAVGRALSGTVAAAGSVLRDVRLARDGAVTPAGDVSRATSLTRAGSVSPAAVISRLFNQSASGAVESTGTTETLRSAVRLLEGAVAAAGTAGKAVTAFVSGAVEAAGSLLQSVPGRITLGGSVAATGSRALHVAKVVRGVVIPAGGITRHGGRRYVIRVMHQAVQWGRATAPMHVRSAWGRATSGMNQKGGMR